MDVKKEREKANLTQEELSQKSGIPRDRISKWEQGKGSPKTEDSRKLEKVFGNNIQDIVPRGKDETLAAGELQDSATLIRILDNLSAAHKEIAESNNKLADNEKEILSRMPAIENDGEDRRIADASILVPLVEILAGIASGKTRYRSKEEAVAELGMKLSLHKSGKGKLKSTPSDGGR